MSAQDNTERVMRSMHILLSRSEIYSKEPSKVLVDKQTMLDLMEELNRCMIEMQEEYELTKQSRDHAEREFRKQGEEIILDASNKAQDVYAASMIYTDDMMERISNIMKESMESVNEIYKNMEDNLKKQERIVRENQSELKSQLYNMRDTEKYLKIIDEKNHEIEREKERSEGKVPGEEPSIYANRQTEVRVNTEFLEKLGLTDTEDYEKESDIEKNKSPQSDEVTEQKADTQNTQALKEAEEKLTVHLDADYFQWKEKQEEQGEIQDVSAKPKNELAEGIHKVWKSLTSHK